MKISKYFEREKNPKKGLMALEWVIVAYMAITLLIVLFCYTRLQHPDSMVWGRVRIVSLTVGLWAAYRFVPCRMMLFIRVLVEMLMLGWWYTDTYSINSLFPNLDHVVASCDQSLFGCQPALLFAQRFSHPVVSEFLEISYVAYYPIIFAVCLFYFFNRYKEFGRCCFVIMASFFSFYLFFDLVPVAGPMYYYPAIGMDNVVNGVFPAVGDYFCNNLYMMKAPGWADGIGYQLIADVHGGERPTGAFPSSHIGLSVVCAMLAAKTRNKTLILSILPFCVGICFATVYIRAHYAIDAVVGLLAGFALYAFWAWVARKYNV